MTKNELIKELCEEEDKTYEELLFDYYLWTGQILKFNSDILFPNEKHLKDNQ